MAQAIVYIKRIPKDQTDELYTMFVQYIREGKISVRQSFLTLFIYMPDAFEDTLIIIHRTLPIVLDALSDEDFKRK